MPGNDLAKAHEAIRSCFSAAAFLAGSAHQDTPPSSMMVCRLVHGIEDLDALELSSDVWTRFHEAFPPQSRIVDPCWRAGVPVPFKTTAGVSATSYHAVALQFCVTVQSAFTCPNGTVTDLLVNGKQGDSEDWVLQSEEGAPVHVRSTAVTRCEVCAMKLSSAWRQIQTVLRGLDSPRMNEILERLDTEYEAAGITARPGGKKKRKRRPPTKQPKSDPDAFNKLVGALNDHHQRANGQCGRLEPIGCRALARVAGVSPGRTSEFFKEKFAKQKGPGYAHYERMCGDPDRINKALEILNNELTPEILSRRLKADPPEYQDSDGEPINAKRLAFPLGVNISTVSTKEPWYFTSPPPNEGTDWIGPIDGGPTMFVAWLKTAKVNCSIKSLHSRNGNGTWYVQRIHHRSWKMWLRSQSLYTTVYAAKLSG